MKDKIHKGFACHDKMSPFPPKPLDPEALERLNEKSKKILELLESRKAENLTEEVNENPST